MESVWSVSKLSTESVGSRRELVANCVHTADGGATKQFRCARSTVSSRRRCVLGFTHLIGRVLWKIFLQFSSVLAPQKHELILAASCLVLAELYSVQCLTQLHQKLTQHSRRNT